MNTVDAVVKQVTHAPWRQYGVWWIEVDYESWGRNGQAKLMFDTREEAEAIKPGYIFQT